ncbi:hypothetical protein ACSBR1_017212 [Camellia fascicularis]
MSKIEVISVVEDKFIVQGITIKNTAGAVNQCGTPVRVRPLNILSVKCDIYGTVDFIFGNAVVIFQNYNIYAQSPPNKTNTITARGRTDPNQNTGISIHNCKVTTASGLKPVQSSVTTFLGHPWKQYSRTIYMKAFLDGLTDPTGWMPWSDNFALSILYYEEYMNTGPGSSTANRVKWGGYHVIISATVASQYTVGSFISGHT